MKKIDPKTIELPPRMAHLERDARGYPIFYSLFINPDSEEVDFTAIDTRKMKEIARKKLCALCGGSLLKTFSGSLWHPTYFIGGAYSVCKSQTFNDGPMHQECAEYATEVCPWMAMPNYKRNLTDEKVKNYIQPNVGAVMNRPPIFGLLKCDRFVFLENLRLFKAVNGRVVRLWKAGSDEPVTDEEKWAYISDVTFGKIK